MTLPAFSAIIASYVPNTGNLGPSGSYNAWVNKINMRKNACNSWATCTKTPDDIWEVAFSYGEDKSCDEGCSGQGDHKCDIKFCDALANVYDYTRRLEARDTIVANNGWRLDDFGWFPSKDISVGDYNMWMYTLYVAKVNKGITDEHLSTTFKGLCVSASGVVVGSNFCAALAAVSIPDGQGPKNGDRTGYNLEDTPIQELEAAYSTGVILTQHQENYVLCSQGRARTRRMCRVQKMCFRSKIMCRLQNICEDRCQEDHEDQNIALPENVSCTQTLDSCESSVSCQLTLGDSCPTTWVTTLL